MATEYVVESIFGRKPAKGDSVETKDFLWDQVVKYLGFIILTLIAFEISFDLLGSEAISCFHPADTFSVLRPNILTAEEKVYMFGIGQAKFLNAFCISSISVNQKFSILLTVQGLLLILPHYIWKSSHNGNFKSFFTIVEKMERLRNSKTGEYSEGNFDRVRKLEVQFGGRKNTIFWTYLLKLIVQLLLACIAPLVYSAILFRDFSFSFECPRLLAETGQAPDDWPLNGTVSCVYPKIRTLRVIQIADFIITALVICLTVYGILWCCFRHTEELGYISIANFVFQSHLKPEDFEFPCFYLKFLHDLKSFMEDLFCCCKKKPNGKCCSAYHMHCDLDFLVLTLFRADSDYGRVFKNVQVTRKLKHMFGSDHQLLHHYITIQNDIKAFNVQMNSGAASFNGSGSVTNWSENLSSENGNDSSKMIRHVMEDYVGLFLFNDDPKNSTYGNFTRHISNTQLLHQGDEAGMRNIVYWFVKKFGRPRQSHRDIVSNDMALDIAFGTFGYSLVLARIFKSVCTVKFSPYYRNPDKMVKKEEFYTNYYIITYPDNIYETLQQNITKANEEIHNLLNDELDANRKVDMIVIGPIRDEYHKVSVDILMHSVRKFYSLRALLLVARPLQIRNTKCSYLEYKPPKRFFEQYDIWSKLNGEELRMLYHVDEEPYFKFMCSGVSCIFEFKAYYYTGPVDHNDKINIPIDNYNDEMP